MTIYRFYGWMLRILWKLSKKEFDQLIFSKYCLVTANGFFHSVTIMRKKSLGTPILFWMCRTEYVSHRLLTNMHSTLNPFVPFLTNSSFFLSMNRKLIKLGIKKPKNEWHKTISLMKLMNSFTSLMNSKFSVQI